jgi:hypothetical protein
VPSKSYEIMGGRVVKTGYVFALALAALLAGDMMRTSALAGSCMEPRAAAEVARIKRQISANRALEAKYSCASGGSFACKEIARRIAAAEKDFASVSGRASARCSVSDIAVAKRAKPAVKRDDAPQRMGAGIETRCVRLSDGYYFPTPNSGYAVAADIRQVVAQCQFICADPNMDVYRVEQSDAERQYDEVKPRMVSMTTGKLYADLFYSGQADLAGRRQCDNSRYYKAVLAASEKTKVSAYVAASTTLEDGPDSEVDAADVTLSVKEALPISAIRRQVRVVGPVFLPEE